MLAITFEESITDYQATTSECSKCIESVYSDHVTTPTHADKRTHSQMQTLTETSSSTLDCSCISL